MEQRERYEDGRETANPLASASLGFHQIVLVRKGTGTKEENNIRRGTGMSDRRMD